MSAITTDNGRNICAAARHLGWTNLSCFSHTLQLGVERVLKLPQIIKAIARCKKIAKHFHHSCKSSYILKEKQKSLGHKELVVIQEVSTRWNSSYYMVERVLLQQQPLCATLLEIHKTDLMPTDSEFKTLEEFISTMKPLVDITEAIGAEKWVTVSTLQPILSKLKTHFVPIVTDSLLVKTMKRTMIEDLKYRYTGDVLKLLTKATLLDPRFKHLKFLSESERKTAVANLKSDYTIVHAQRTNSTEPAAPAPKRTKGEHKLLEFIGVVSLLNLYQMKHQQKSS